MSITSGKAAGEVSAVVCAVMDGIQLLGAGVLSYVVSDSRQAAKAKEAVATITSMVRDAAWRSDAIRDGAQAAAQGALPALKDAKERHDFKAAADSMVEVAGTLGSELQKPDVRQMTTQATGLFIDAASSRLGAKDVGDPLPSSGQVKPRLDQFLRIVGQMLQDPGKREALKGAAATPVQTAGTVGGSLQNGNAKEAVTSGAGLIIKGLGSKLQTANATS